MQIILNEPLDMHLHLRDNELLEKVIKFSSKFFSGAIVMPNLQPPLTTKKSIDDYKNRIKKLTKDDNFEPYMTIFLKEALSFETLKELKNSIKAVKLYPSGATTNSENGLTTIDTDYLQETFNSMAELNIPLSIHGETDGFSLDRETEFLDIYEDLAIKFPKLKIIMEHITTKKAVELLKKYDNLYATITLHHLLFTLDDLIGGSLNHHLFCKPILKRESDRKALVKLATSKNKKVMFGSDSAPHTKEAKIKGAAGIFSSPILINGLVELFEKENALDNLQSFISDNAKNIYGISTITKKLYIEKIDYKVESEYNGIVPMLANKTLSWKIIKVEN